MKYDTWYDQEIFDKAYAQFLKEGFNQWFAEIKAEMKVDEERRRRIEYSLMDAEYKRNNPVPQCFKNFN